MEITSPVFDKIVFSLDPHYYGGKTFTVIVYHNKAKDVYIQKTLLNNKIYNKCYMDFSEIKAGSTLELFMGEKLNKEWGID